MKETAPPGTPAPAGRNKCLDFFKGIAALCVVFVHISFPGKFGKCISSTGSCGVMLFFLISGFHAFGSREEMCPKLMKRFRRNLCITITAVLVYFAAAFARHHFFVSDQRSWLRTFTKPSFYLRMLLFSDLEDIFADPLWFMFALLYAYLIFWAMYKLHLQRFAKYAMPLFILLRIVLETYKYAVNGDWRICSNVLVAALPLMLLGYCIAEQKDKLMKIPAWAAAVCAAVSLICMFLLIIFDPFRWNITQIFKLTVVASVFVFSMKKPDLRIFPPLCKLGGAYSLHVYLWHMPLIVILYPLLERYVHSQVFFDWYFPLIIAASAVLLAVVIVTVQHAVRKCTAKRKA